MSSLLGTNLEQEKKAEEKRGGEMLSTRHEPVYHAAHGCQAAWLSLTASRLRGLFWACQVESQKTAGFFACLARPAEASKLLCVHEARVRAQRWPSHSSGDAATWQR